MAPAVREGCRGAPLDNKSDDAPRPSSGIRQAYSPRIGIGSCADRCPRAGLPRGARGRPRHAYAPRAAPHAGRRQGLRQPGLHRRRPGARASPRTSGPIDIAIAGGAPSMGGGRDMRASRSVNAGGNSSRSASAGKSVSGCSANCTTGDRSRWREFSRLRVPRTTWCACVRCWRVPRELAGDRRDAEARLKRRTGARADGRGPLSEALRGPRTVPALVTRRISASY